jgi:hypothetical protein
MCHYHLFNYRDAYTYLLEAIRIKELIFPKNDERIRLAKKNLVEIKKQLFKEEKHTFIKGMLQWIKSF